MKTTPTTEHVSTFLKEIDDPVRRADAKTINQLLKEITGKRPVMWGEQIVGFDSYHYTRADKSEHDFFVIGFSPRKHYLSIYIMPGYQDFGDLLAKLGPHQKGKACLNIKRLENIHMSTLKKLLTKGYKNAVKKLK